MLFNTLTYLFFLPIVFVLYWLGKSRLWQNIVIVGASMVFYGWWDVRFLGLMILTCLLNYGIVLGLTRSEQRSRWLLILGLTTNFGILGVFKYYDFFVQSLMSMLAWGGVVLNLELLHLVLPVGISFYTFQLSSYLVDCYRRTDGVPRSPSLLTFMGFVMFFPQLVAGPIERAKDLLGQMQERRRFDFGEAREGMRLILWGLMKKMLLADNCAMVANMIFEGYANATLADLWLGALAFTFQIYGDFSGYSDMAIGSARLLGIRLSQNFDKPYFSATIPEFWRRWHMTLMSWFRDYVYIPLGGSRRGVARRHLNVGIVFLLSGLWHGANWTFVAWGLYHAVWSGLMSGRKYPKGFGLLTFVIVLIGWVIFRSPDLSVACSYIAGMFDPGRWGGTTYSRLCLAYIAVFVACEAMMSQRRHPFAFRDCGLWRFQTVRLTMYLLCFLLTLYFGGQQVDFIYFQF